METFQTTNGQPVRLQKVQIIQAAPGGTNIQTGTLNGQPVLLQVCNQFIYVHFQPVYILSRIIRKSGKIFLSTKYFKKSFPSKIILGIPYTPKILIPGVPVIKKIYIKSRRPH